MGDRQPPAPPALPPSSPSRPPPDPARVARATRVFAGWLLGTALLTMLPLPWNLVGLPLAVMAIVTGIRAAVLGIRARTRPLTVGLVSAGVAFSGMVVLGLLGS